MAYNESFYTDCTVGYYTYDDTFDDCLTSYSDYSDCEVVYSDYSDCEVVYSNYSDCEVVYSDYSNYCSQNYDDYANYNNSSGNYYDYEDCEVSYSNYHDYCEQSYYNYEDCEVTYGDEYNGFSYYDYEDCEVSYDDEHDFCFMTYYDYGDCEVSYDDYGDYCLVSYDDYADYCTVSYYDEPTCEVSYYDELNCEVSYDNYANDCSTSYTYTNHVDYSNYDSGSPQSLTWGANWSGDTMVATYISDSINALKEIRDNIELISFNKGQQDVSSSNVSSETGDSEDSKFNANEKVDDLQYDAMRNTLEELYTALTGVGAGLEVKDLGDKIKKTEWEALKTKADDLMESYIDSYNNTVSYNIDGYTDYNENIPGE